MKDQRTTKYAALSHLFSKAVFRDIASSGVSKKGAEVLQSINYLPPESLSLGTFFDIAFKRLAKSERSEYVYKNAIAERILLGRHSLNTARMLLEFRIGTNKADALILNGTSTAYEIKSERDSLIRLEDQLQSYLKACEHVYVVCSEKHLSQIETIIPNVVGILVLTKRYQLSEIRPAISDLSHLDLGTMFESLQRAEYLGIINELVGWTGTDIPNGVIHQQSKKIFETLDIHDVHPLFIKSLRERASSTNSDDLLLKVPNSLKALTVSTRLTGKQHINLLKALELPAKNAFSMI